VSRYSTPELQSRSLIVEREVRGTISSDVDAERNRLREATLLYGSYVIGHSGVCIVIGR